MTTKEKIKLLLGAYCKLSFAISILRGPGVPTERLGKIGLYLNIFYAPYFCRCLGLEE